MTAHGAYKSAKDVVVASPFVFLSDVLKESKEFSKENIDLDVSAQNCSQTGHGAFTGEVNSLMLKSIGINWVILGHSERRKLFKECPGQITRKLTQCNAQKLKVIFCIGETLEQRENNELETVLKSQLKSLLDVENLDWTSIVIAYEPVWAIGTGKVATPKEAQDAHLFVRNWLKINCSEKIAENTRIIYGGSVKPNNAKELFSKEDIDGFLVGGASLKADMFADIIAATD